MKVLYIATTAKKRNRLDGETVKCKLLEEYLQKQENIHLKSVDTDNWKHHILKLVFFIIIYFFWCDKVVISSADRGANIILNFFRKVNCKKEIYYFVIGGSLYMNITEKKWNVESYTRIKEIYVEAKSLKENLNSIGITNIQVVNNFRLIKPFKNMYQKEIEIRFVFFGRIIKAKGIEEAIRLINRLNKNGYKCRLDIFGQVSKEYLKEISKLFTEKIQYKGEIKPDNKTEYEILSQYDIFILPTEYPGECLPGALIDSYVAGLAVVVSDWQYAREYVEDNKNGIIFKYKDYEDMFEKTKKMITSNLIQKFKNRSLELSKKYLIDENLKDFIEKILR